MKPDLWRPLLGMLGLAIGFGVYPLIGRLPEPWPPVVVGLLFLALGAAAWVYAQGERWIQVLGLLLALYGLARMLFFR
ncbi:hypothetical protein [Deinococcus budaensis]|uniref:DUF4175 domain-containing protein n=1 Tax=Deinococcus budaensis TaxID=1665626 RepID=A0A7W8GIB1_9DEIO|nr:hypothetical protein [Deinococcus budaensis]